MSMKKIETRNNQSTIETNPLWTAQQEHQEEAQWRSLTAIHLSWDHSWLGGASWLAQGEDFLLEDDPLTSEDLALDFQKILDLASKNLEVAVKEKDPGASVIPNPLVNNLDEGLFFCLGKITLESDKGKPAPFLLIPFSKKGEDDNGDRSFILHFDEARVNPLWVDFAKRRLGHSMDSFIDHRMFFSKERWSTLELADALAPGSSLSPKISLVKLNLKEASTALALAQKEAEIRNNAKVRQILTKDWTSLHQSSFLNSTDQDLRSLRLMNSLEKRDLRQVLNQHALILGQGENRQNFLREVLLNGLCRQENFLIVIENEKQLAQWQEILESLQISSASLILTAQLSARELLEQYDEALKLRQVKKATGTKNEREDLLRNIARAKSIFKKFDEKGPEGLSLAVSLKAFEPFREVEAMRQAPENLQYEGLSLRLEHLQRLALLAMEFPNLGNESAKKLGKQFDPEKLGVFLAKGENFQFLQKGLDDYFPGEILGESLTGLKAIAQLISQTRDLEEISQSYQKINNVDDLLHLKKDLATLLKEEKQLAQAKSQISETFDLTVFTLDLKELAAKQEEFEASQRILRLFKASPIKKELIPHFLGSDDREDKLKSWLKDLLEIQLFEEELEKEILRLKSRYGLSFLGPVAEEEKLEDLANLLLEKSLKNPDHYLSLLQNQHTRDGLYQWYGSLIKALPSLTDFYAVGDLSEEEKIQPYFEAISQWMEALKGTNLLAWQRFQEELKEVDDLGMADVAGELLAGNINAMDLERFYLASFWTYKSRELIHNLGFDPLDSMEELIQTYLSDEMRLLDLNEQELTEVRSRALPKLLERKEIVREINILQGYLKKEQGLLITDLIEELWELTKALFPIIITGPGVATQDLPLEEDAFHHLILEAKGLSESQSFVLAYLCKHWLSLGQEAALNDKDHERVNEAPNPLNPFRTIPWSVTVQERPDPWADQEVSARDTPAASSISRALRRKGLPLEDGQEMVELWQRDLSLCISTQELAFRTCLDPLDRYYFLPLSLLRKGQGMFFVHPLDYFVNPKKTIQDLTTRIRKLTLPVQRKAYRFYDPGQNPGEAENFPKGMIEGFLQAEAPISLRLLKCRLDLALGADIPLKDLLISLKEKELEVTRSGFGYINGAGSFSEKSHSYRPNHPFDPHRRSKDVVKEEIFAAFTDLMRKEETDLPRGKYQRNALDELAQQFGEKSSNEELEMRLVEIFQTL